MHFARQNQHVHPDRHISRSKLEPLDGGNQIEHAALKLARSGFIIHLPCYFQPGQRWYLLRPHFRRGRD